MQRRPYLEHLRALAFVSDARIIESGNEDIDGVLELDTPTGTHRMLVETKSTNLSHATAAEAIAFMNRRQPREDAQWIVFAPGIGPGIAGVLREHNIDYVDLAGNCSVRVGDQYVAHIEGRRRPTPKPGRRGIGAAGYRALFAVLATPALLPCSVRAIAKHAGVNRQTVSEMLERLATDGIVVREPRRSWVEGKRRRALEQWLAGYVGTVRSKLWIGAFRSTDDTPDRLRERIAPLLDELSPRWRWGGEWAGFLLNRHFRGHRTVVHIADELPIDLGRRLRISRHDDGPLVILGVPGPEAWKSPHPGTVHPLLVWSELMASGNERASEAAAQPIMSDVYDGADRLLADYAAELSA